MQLELNFHRAVLLRRSTAHGIPQEVRTCLRGISIGLRLVLMPARLSRRRVLEPVGRD
jgi:hypothetical protein